MNEETLLDALNRVSYENAVLTIENSAYCAEIAKLRAAVAWESQRVDALHLAAANDEVDMKELRAENAARAEKIKLMRSREEAYDNRIERLEAENAALRARLDDCAAGLMADAEGR